MKREWAHTAGHVIWMSVNLLAVSCLILADCSVFISPEHHSLPALIGIGFEVLIWINILLSLSWLLTQRKRYALVGAIILLLSLPNILHTWSHGSGKADDNKAHELRILTYNTHCTHSTLRAAQNPTLHYIRESGADIVCLQEYEVQKDPTRLTFEGAKAYLADIYPYTYFDFATYNKKRQYGLAIYSRYPLINKQSLHYHTRHNISCRCDVVAYGDTIRLFHNHLESNALTPKDMMLDDEGDLTESVRTSAFRILHKMIQAYAYRAEEARYVHQEVLQSPHPAIVAGDCNDVPVSYTYHTLSRGLNDAFLSTSWGKRGHTFKKGGLGVRIDYLLSSPELQATECRVDTITLSDHQPVMATFRF